MLELISWINLGLTWIFERILWPFRQLNPLWGLAFVSLLAGLFMLWVFAKFSNQQGIRRAKDRVRGNLLAVRIFQHDISVVLRLQASIFRDTFTYFRHSLFPLVVMFVPLALILIQLNLFFSKQPLPVGGESTLTVSLESSKQLTKVSLKPASFYQVESPPVRVERLQEVSWRIEATQPGRHIINIEANDQVLEKELVVGKYWDAVSSLRTSTVLDLIFFSGERPIPSSSGIRSIEIQYADLPIPIFGWNGNWFILFLIFSVASAFLSKGFFGVEI